MNPNLVVLVAKKQTGMVEHQRRRVVHRCCCHMLFHTTLCHPGINRPEEAIGQHLWWPNMRDHITNYVKICPVCQRNKRRQKKYGLLPPKEAKATPWDKLCVD
jgi:hypothetical protein